MAVNGYLDRWIKVVGKRSDELVVCDNMYSTVEAAESELHSTAPAARATVPPAGPPDLPQGRVQLVVSEILDSQLLGEGVLPTMRHACKRLMQVGCQVSTQCYTHKHTLTCVRRAHITSCLPPSVVQPFSKLLRHFI
jgi:hypothetical protein